MPTSQTDYASFLAGSTNDHNGKVTSIDEGATKIYVSLTSASSVNLRLVLGKNDGTTQIHSVSASSSANQWRSTDIDTTNVTNGTLFLETGSITSTTQVRFYYN